MTRVYTVRVAVEHVEQHNVRAKSAKEAQRIIRDLITGAGPGTVRVRWSQATRDEARPVQVWPPER